MKTPPADDVPDDVRRRAHFVKPELVAEIAFRGFTDEGYVRQGSYKGLRKDKPARQVVTETPVEAPDPPPGKDGRARTPSKEEVTVPKPSAVITVDLTRHDKAIEVEGVRLTHPDKVVFPGNGITKRQLAAYYLLVKDRILPLPSSTGRCRSCGARDGAEGDCFFQKHASAGVPRRLQADPHQGEGGERRLSLYRGRPRADRVRPDGRAGSFTSGARTTIRWRNPTASSSTSTPTRTWAFAQVRDAAKDMRDRLKALGLETFPMVTGGKGIHAVAPLHAALRLG